jgi:pSer/pThr/pTyr-binding forkhead associated (FHA) protein
MGRDGAFTITDLNSGNGTIVNGKRITQSSLSDGDLIEIGEVRFTFKKNA